MFRVHAGGYSNACLEGLHSQDGQSAAHGLKPLGGWRFGNTIDGSQAEFLLVPDAMANLAPVPDGLTDEQVLMCPDIMSTGFAGAEAGNIMIGDTVVVFAQGPIGLCVTAGARMRGAATIIAVETVPERIAMAKRFGADIVIDFGSLITHRFKLDEIEEAYELFANQRDGVMVVAITP